MVISVHWDVGHKGKTNEFRMHSTFFGIKSWKKQENKGKIWQKIHMGAISKTYIYFIGFIQRNLVGVTS